MNKKQRQIRLKRLKAQQKKSMKLRRFRILLSLSHLFKLGR